MAGNSYDRNRDDFQDILDLSNTPGDRSGFGGFALSGARLQRDTAVFTLTAAPSTYEDVTFETTPYLVDAPSAGPTSI